MLTDVILRAVTDPSANFDVDELLICTSVENTCKYSSKMKLVKLSVCEVLP